MKRDKNIIRSIIIFVAIFYKYLSFYEIESELVTKVFILIAIIFSIVIIVNRKFNKKQLFTVIIPFIFIIAISRSLDFVIILLIALMFSKDNIKEFFKIFFLSSLFCYLLTVFLNSIGVLEDNSIRRITEDGVILRNSLGFTHVNGVFKNVMPVFLSGYLIIKKENINKYNIIVFVVSTILFIISNSRTGYICVIIYLLFTSFINIMKYKTVRESIKYMFLICTIISLCLAYFYGKSLDNSVNELLSNRPVIWKYYIFDAKAISFINSNFAHMSIDNSLPIDNTYFTYLINYGILTYTIVLLMKYFAIKKINDKRILLAILIFAIYGIFENLTSYGLDFTFIIQLIYLLDIKKKDSKGSEHENISQEDTQNEYILIERE